MGVACCGCEQQTKSQEVGKGPLSSGGCVCLDPNVTADLDSISSLAR